ncbi:MAG: glycosyltransferase family 9 protein [Vampirovibrionales bacterium]
MMLFFNRDTLTRIPLEAPLLLLPSRYLGDTLLSIPLVVSLRERYPNTPFYIAVEPQTKPLWACYATSLKLILVDLPRGKGMKGLWQQATILKTTAGGRPYGAVLALKRSFSSALLARLLPAAYRVGFSSQGRSWLLHNTIPYPTEGHELHRLHQLIQLFEPSNHPSPTSPVLSLYAPEWSQNNPLLPLYDTLQTKQPLWSIQPFTSNSRKDWQADALRTWLKQALTSHPTHHFMLLGSQQDATRLSALVASLSLPPSQQSRVILSAGTLSLEETWYTIAQSERFIGADSVGLHMAASVGTPCTALFGPSDESQWYPYPYTRFSTSSHVAPQYTAHTILTTHRQQAQACKLKKTCACLTRAKGHCMAFTTLE